MITLSQLPLVNATLNGISFLLLIWGRFEISRGNREKHRRLMVSAFMSSSIFLACYLYYHFNTEIITTYKGDGIGKYFYYAMLISHIILAVAMLPGIFLTFYYAFQKNFTKHRRLAPLVWGVWAYVSLTGVLIYWVLWGSPIFPT